MRVFIVDTCYPRFIEAHYAASPGLENASYEVQWRALMDTLFGTSDAYSHNLRALGHEAREFVVNCTPLQAAWARERGLDLDVERAREDVLLAQVRDFEPDVVYVQHVHFLSDSALRELKRISGYLVGQLATDPPNVARLRAFDLITTALPQFVEWFPAAGVRTELLRIAFDERALARVESAPPHEEHAVVFVGSLGRTQHRGANALLARAARRLEIDFWGYGARYWPPWSPVKRRYRGEAWGVDMYRVLYASRIALNRHAAIAGRFACNMRLFEATGMGTLLLTDRKDNLAELFDVGSEVVDYETADELVERARHYLEHDEERRRIASAGQERTLREHTYRTRMPELLEILDRNRP